jgi:hypothetical protein
MDSKLNILLEQPIKQAFHHHDNEAINLRTKYWKDFNTNQLPDKNNEDWKYTNLNHIFKKFGINTVQIENLKYEKNIFEKLIPNYYEIHITNGSSYYTKKSDNLVNVKITSCLQEQDTQTQSYL